MNFRPDFSNRRGASLSMFERTNRRACENPLEAATNYAEFQRLLNQRRIALGMSLNDLDARSGLADGYTSKILCLPARPHGRFMRNIGPLAMDRILPALKVRIRLEPRLTAGGAQLDRFAPCAALGEASAHGIAISHERTLKTCVGAASARLTKRQHRVSESLMSKS